MFVFFWCVEEVQKTSATFFMSVTFLGSMVAYLASLLHPSPCVIKKELTPSHQPNIIMSNKTVRMSADEKRRAVLGIYHRTKMVYTEKEIIALAAKAGVNQNT